MNIPQRILDAHKWLRDWSICTAYRGSVAHGMYVPPTDPNSIDDRDLMAIVVCPIDHYFGLREFGSRGTKEIMAPCLDAAGHELMWDIVGYEVRKFVSLLAKGNPNVLSMLWLPENCYLKRTDAFDLLVANRDAFATRRVYHAFVGYAHGQLHRMTHQKFEGYMGEKRKALVEKFGYDTKNAAHLIRILRMGAEFLKDGQMRVLREDATQLLEIKRGEWTLNDVKLEADRWFKNTEQSYLNSALPAEPDYGRVNALSVDVVSLAMGYLSHRAEVLPVYPSPNDK